MNRTSVPAALLFSCLLALGCGGGAATGPTLALPGYDPDALAKAALQQLDKSGDGLLDAGELEACPGLRDALAEIDSNGDKKLSADELRDRFGKYAGAGAASVTCVVTVDGKPAAGVDVRFVPEPFMGSEFKPASGTTGEAGRATLKADGQDAFGVPSGVYKVVVTRTGKDLPAKYNTKTTLGREVFDGSRGSSGEVELRLKSN